MIRYNSNNIIVGEIKQLLHSFNLPKATVWKDQTEFIPNRIYIKDHNVYRSSMDGSSLSQIENLSYEWGDALLNITHTLDITSETYDSYTHRYLGDYLRFLRDYKGINLMSMYNCFSNEIPSKFDEIYMSKGNIKHTFSSSDGGHKLYMIPIKLGQVYTIALNTSRPIEMAAGYYAHGELLQRVSGSFRFKSSCSSSEVFLYDGVADKKPQDIGQDYYNKEDCLYLFLNLSRDYDSSIVVLEGDYSSSTDVFINSGGYTEICYAPAAYNESKTDLFVPETSSRLQLLNCKSSFSYPFADKLLQYLFSHVITPVDEIASNIKRAQSTLYNKGYLNYITRYGTWTKEDTAACLLCSHKNTDHREITKDYDVIGYLDSDIESELGGLE